jgi:endonuclease YncB( thermonuclease family)
VRVWPGIEIATKVRLRNIDAPEMRARCEQELSMAHAARDALVEMLAEGEVTIGRIELDKYGGRVLADASASRSGDVSTALLGAGLVRRYSGGRREPWC